MLRLKILMLTAVIVTGHWTLLTADADAGFLRDWMERRRARRACIANCQSCSTRSTPAATPVTANYTGLQPGQCATTCMKTCSKVVVNYVPCTSYRTTCERVPVTQYRPQTKVDPCTGCTVTCMRPCTTYTYCQRRVPYTTYRPVYRTVNYRVPVTTITNECCPTPSCSPCAAGPVASPCADGSCGVPQSFSSQSFASPTPVVPNGTLSTGGTFSTLPPTLPPGTTVTPLPTPADTTPGINPQNSNRPVIDQIVPGSSTNMTLPPPSTNSWSLTAKNPANRNWTDVPVVNSSVADSSPVTRKWNYNPVRQASYVSISDDVAPAPRTIRGQFSPLESQAEPETKLMNEGWQTVQW